MKPEPTNMFMKSCLVLAIVLAASSERFDTLESESIDSNSPDSGSLEDKAGYDTYDRNVPYIEMRGNLRKTMAYHVILTDTRKSWVSSPLSALLSLGKIAIGSSSRRYSKLKEAIGYKRKKLGKRFKEIMDAITHVRGKLVLIMASKIYVSDKDDISYKFTGAVRKVFKSTCEKVDFYDSTETAKKINSWMSSETNGIIRRIILPSEIKYTSSLIIINGIYFRGNWKNSFESVKTEPFYIIPGRGKDIKMMSTKGQYNYFRSTHLKAQIIEIPYASKGQISLIIVLPFDVGGLSALVHQLANLPEGLNAYMKQMRKTTLKLAIPKFRVASDLSMDSIYKKLGLREILEPGNKVLTKIAKYHGVYVTRSYQSVIFDVFEHGSDGGVADTMQLEIQGKDKDREEFKANHPFLFFVVANNEQLFAGSFVGP